MKDNTPTRITKGSGITREINVPNPKFNKTEPVKIEENHDPEHSGEFTYAEWKIDGFTPKEIKEKYIDKTAALIGGTEYKASLVKGLGIFPVLLNHYEIDGTINADVVKDMNIIHFCQSTMVKNLLYQAALNYYQYRVLFIELILNEPRTEIIDISVVDSYMGRWGERDKKNNITHAYFAGDWDDDVSVAKAEKVPVLNAQLPLEDLTKQAKEGKKGKFIYPFFTSKEMYPRSSWLSARTWCDVEQKSSLYVHSFYDNSLGITFLLKVPMEYINEYFPESNYKSQIEQLAAVDEWLDTLEQDLTKVEDKHKTITCKSVEGADGKPVYIEIETIESKVNFNNQILSADQADRKIFTALRMGDAVILDRGTGSGLNSGSEKRVQNNIDLMLVNHEWDLIRGVLNLIRAFNKMPPNLMFLPLNVIQTTMDKSPTGMELQ